MQVLPWHYMPNVSWLTTLTILSTNSTGTCTYFVYFKSMKELNYDRFADLNILQAARLVHSDLRIYWISFFLLDRLHPPPSHWRHINFIMSDITACTLHKLLQYNLKKYQCKSHHPSKYESWYYSQTSIRFIIKTPIHIMNNAQKQTQYKECALLHELYSTPSPAMKNQINNLLMMI